MHNTLHNLEEFEMLYCYCYICLFCILVSKDKNQYNEGKYVQNFKNCHFVKQNKNSPKRI